MALPAPNSLRKTLRPNFGSCSVVLRPFRMFSLGQRVQPATMIGFKQIEFFDHTTTFHLASRIKSVLSIQNTIFMTNTINLGSEVSSMDDTLTCPNCELVTLLDARFPNHGWLNALWKSVRTCHRTLSLIGNSL